MRPHTTHHDDCGCLSARHAQEIAAANDAIKRLQRKLDDAERHIAELTEALSGGKPDGR